MSVFEVTSKSTGRRYTFAADRIESVIEGGEGSAILQTKNDNPEDQYVIDADYETVRDRWVKCLCGDFRVMGENGIPVRQDRSLDRG
jgi:hypothetical protein